MTIAAILDRKGGAVISIGADARVIDGIGMLAENRIGAMPVVQDGILVGIMSERDLVYCLSSDGAEMLTWPVERIMTSPALSVPPTMPVLAALSMMTERRIRHLPVVQDDRLIGIVSIGDLVKHRMDRIEEEAAAMRSYIQGS